MGKDSKYLEQLKRVKRWYGRFKKINNGTKHQVSSDHLKDEVLAFFVNCYQLKDWLQNDSTLEGIFKIDKKRNENEIEEFINQHRSLCICADLCNGSKHLRLTSSRNDKNTKVASQDIKLELGKEKPKISMTFWVKSGKKGYNAFELATDCLELWEEFLQDHGLEID